MASEEQPGTSGLSDGPPRLSASRFNILVPLAGGAALLFNSRTLALAEIEAEHLPTVEGLLRGTRIADDEQSRGFLQVLEEGRFLVGSAVDEIEDMESRAAVVKGSRDLLQLTIAPTLACNFRCSYCFEDTRTGVMTPEIEAATARFAGERMRGAKALAVSWFGGEPTLRPDIIERLTDRLDELARQQGVKMHPAGLVTNGFLLDRPMAERLARARVAMAQVTLDGPRLVHDARRPQANGEGSFDRILANVAEVTDVMRVCIRINIDTRNTGAMGELLEHLGTRGLLQKVPFYFAQVNDSSGACASMSGQCYRGREFAAATVSLYRELLNRGYTDVEYPVVPDGIHCAASCEQAFVIAPDGRLYKCWEELGSPAARPVGRVDAPAGATMGESTGIPSHPFADSECRACQVLPLCLGGCPTPRGMAATDKEERCVPWRFNLQEMLHLRHEGLKTKEKEVTT